MCAWCSGGIDRCDIAEAPDGRLYCDHPVNRSRPSRGDGQCRLLRCCGGAREAGVGIGAMFLAQSAFQAGRLAAAQPGGRWPTPVVAVAGSLFLFGDHARLGLFLIGEVAGGVLIVMAVVLLARSPYLEGRAGSHEDAAPAAGSPEP